MRLKRREVTLLGKPAAPNDTHTEHTTFSRHPHTSYAQPHMDRKVSLLEEIACCVSATSGRGESTNILDLIRTPSREHFVYLAHKAHIMGYELVISLNFLQCTFIEIQMSITPWCRDVC